MRNTDTHSDGMPSLHAQHATSQRPGQGGTLPCPRNPGRLVHTNSLTQGLGGEKPAFPRLVARSETVEPCAAPQAARDACVTHNPPSLPNHRPPGLRNARTHIDSTSRQGLESSQETQQDRQDIGPSRMCRKESARFAPATRPHGTRGQGPRSHTGTSTSTCASKWTLRQPKLCRAGGVLRHNLPGPINARRRGRCSVLGSEPESSLPLRVVHLRAPHLHGLLRMLGDGDRPRIPCIKTRALELHRFLSEAEYQSRMLATHSLWTTGLTFEHRRALARSHVHCVLLAFSCAVHYCLLYYLVWLYRTWPLLGQSARYSK